MEEAAAGAGTGIPTITQVTSRSGRVPVADSPVIKHDSEDV